MQILYPWPNKNIVSVTQYKYCIRDPVQILCPWPNTNIVSVTQYKYYIRDPIQILYPWPNTNISQNHSLVSKYHTILEYIRKRNFIYAQTMSTAFTAPSYETRHCL
jgi:hypothetical protein